MDPESSDLDASAIASVITGATLCGDCITRMSGIARWRVADALQRLATSVKVTSNTRHCSGCQSACSFIGQDDPTMGKSFLIDLRVDGVVS